MIRTIPPYLRLVASAAPPAPAPPAPRSRRGRKPAETPAPPQLADFQVSGLVKEAEHMADGLGALKAIAYRILAQAEAGDRVTLTALARHAVIEAEGFASGAERIRRLATPLPVIRRRSLESV